MSASIGTHEFCETTARSANVPSMQNPPRSAPSSSWNLNVPSASIPVIICAPQSQRFWRPVEQYRQIPQAGMNEQTTWSPTLTRVTSGPTASITPAPSWPPTIGSRPVESPVRRCSSEWHIPDAANLIRTSPCSGSSSSSSVTSHGLPGSLMIAALVRIPTVLYLRSDCANLLKLRNSRRSLWPVTRRRGRTGPARREGRPAGAPAARAWIRGCRSRSPQWATSPPGRPPGPARIPAARSA